VLFEFLQCGAVHRRDDVGVELCCFLTLRQGLAQQLREVQTEEIRPCKVGGVGVGVGAESCHRFLLLINSTLQIPTLATSWGRYYTSIRSAYPNIIPSEEHLSLASRHPNNEVGVGVDGKAELGPSGDRPLQLLRLKSFLRALFNFLNRPNHGADVTISLLGLSGTPLSSSKAT